LHGTVTMTIRATDILDSEIVDREGRPLGKVSDIVLDAGLSGTVCYVLIGLQNTGDRASRTVALPWSLLAHSGLEPGTSGPLTLDVSRSTLRGLRHVTGD